MAGIQRTIEILFSGTDNVSGVAESIGDNLSGIGDGIQDATQPFADLTAAIGVAEAAFAGLVGVAIAGKADIEDLGKSIQATLGITADEAAGLADEVKEIFAEGFDLEISTEAVTFAFQQFRDSAEEDVGAIASSATKISQAFGGDLKQTIDATKTLTEQFGLTGKEALDFIASGFQSGLDRSGDFLETINEYSTQFSSGGASAEQFFSLLDSGLQGGILGTDRAADAFKEFRVRIQDGSKSTREGLEAIGINAADMAAKFQNGSITAAEAFQIVLKNINETDDQSKAFQAGVALLGTQFEDLGDKAAKGLTLAGTEMEDLAGSADQVAEKFDTIGQAAQAAFNSILASFADTDALDGLSDKFEKIFQNIAENFPKALEGVDFSGLNDALEDVLSNAEGLISDFFGGVDLSTPEGLEAAIQAIVDALEGFQDIVGGVIDGFGPLVGFLGDALDYFNDLSPEVKATAGFMLALATQANLAAGALSGIGGAISGAGQALGGLSTAGKAGTAAIGKLATALGPAGLVVAAGAAGAAIGTLINQIPGVQETVQGVIAEVDNFLGGVFSAGPTLDEMEKIDNAFFAAKQQFQETQKAAEDTSEAIANVPGEKEVNIATNTEEAQAKLNQLGGDVDSLTTDEFLLAIGIDDQASNEVRQAKEEFLALDGTVVEFVGKADTEDAKKAIEELVPPDKRLELQVELETAQIEADAERFAAQMEALQSSVEWEAKLDIAQVEANARQVEAAFESVNTTIQSTGDVISESLGLLVGLGDGIGNALEKFAITEQIRKENELRERAIKLQEKLTEQQIVTMRDLSDRLNSDDPIKLTLNTDNLSPALELVWEEILEALQDQAVLEGGDMLVSMLGSSS
jgi:phage-related minor tail protein